MLQKVGKPKGLAKSGGAKKGAVHAQTLAVKEAILRVFHELNKDDEYLKKMAEEDRHLFMSIVAKILPTTVGVEVTHSVDIGAAMEEANKRLIEHQQIINVTPEANTAPATSSDIIASENKPQRPPVRSVTRRFRRE